MKLITLLIVIALSGIDLSGQEKQYIWPKDRMPDVQEHQIAAMTDESESAGFDADTHRRPYLEWFDAPSAEKHTGGCMILISGGSYECCCDVGYVNLWKERFTELGFQCVNLVYRTPRPVGLPIYQTAWEDGQRAVRIVRSEAEKRGFDPEKIGVISMSAGSHLALLLATSSQTPAYARVDRKDDRSCHINWAIVNAPAYGTTDGEAGTPATKQGYGSDVTLSDVFKFDDRTCPMSLHHGGADVYAPHTSTLVYRELRKMGIPAELHLYADEGHGAFGLERGVEFMRQMGFMGPPDDEVALMDRFSDDSARGGYAKENLWPEGGMPDVRSDQCIPYIEWHFPKELKTTAIQIVYSGGSYDRNDPDGFEVAPVRRFLNEKGMTVVTLKYRTPRPEGLAKHTTAWQDLQRTIRLVRSEAAERGLDPDRIGIMGSSAGGHLTLMGVTSSRHASYLPVDDVDRVSCDVQWGIGIYPAYALTDGLDAHNTTGGNDDCAVIAPEFSFDLDTAPMLFIHGDSDGWAAMNSVKIWEKMLQMGIQSELHTLATRTHCFQRTASPGTGSYTFLDRIWEFLTAKGFNGGQPDSVRTVSVLGDSYSTFDGYVPEGNAVWYFTHPHGENDVTAVEQTWWHILCEEGGCRLLLNDSYSGSTVCNTGYDGADYSDRSFITRMKRLTYGVPAPDVLLVFGATNDSWANVPIGPLQYSGWTAEDLYSCIPAYCYMLDYLTSELPDTEIVCIVNSELKDEITDGIVAACAHYGTGCILLKDIEKLWGHPSIKGMSQISDQLSTFLSGRK